MTDSREIIPLPVVSLSAGVLRGYARVSTSEQNLDLQLDALKGFGCVRIYLDKMSGAYAKRPGLDKMLDELKPHDTVVVWKLDRIGRSLVNLVHLIEGFNHRGVNLKVLTSGIDTTTHEGALIFGIMASLAEYERALIKERINAGIAAARKRGVKLGKPPKFTEEKLNAALVLIQGDMMLKDVARQLGVDRTTLWRNLPKDV